MNVIAPTPPETGARWPRRRSARDPRDYAREAFAIAAGTSLLRPERTHFGELTHLIGLRLEALRMYVGSFHAVCERVHPDDEALIAMMIGLGHFPAQPLTVDLLRAAVRAFRQVDGACKRCWGGKALEDA